MKVASGMLDFERVIPWYANRSAIQAIYDELDACIWSRKKDTATHRRWAEFIKMKFRTSSWSLSEAGFAAIHQWLLDKKVYFMHGAWPTMDLHVMYSLIAPSPPLDLAALQNIIQYAPIGPKNRELLWHANPIVWTMAVPEVQSEMAETFAKCIFMMIVFLTDGYLRGTAKRSQFFRIAARLPLDLQHVLARRAAGLRGITVLPETEDWRDLIVLFFAYAGQ